MPKKRKPTQQPPREPLNAQPEPRTPLYMDALAGAVVPLLLAPLLDPYSVLLEEMIASRKPNTTGDPLLKLRQMHHRALRYPQDLHPLDADTARSLAEDVGIRSPSWALDILKAVQASLLRDRRVNLNQALGFTAVGRGKTSEAERRVRVNVLDRSMLQIVGLSLLGVTVKAACHMEAGRMQRLAGWNRTDYDIEPDLQTKAKDPDTREQKLFDKRLKYAEQLRQQYYDWRTDIEKDPNSDFSKYFRQCLLAKREAFLAQFPKD